MEFKGKESVIERLFDLICSEKENEDEILTILRNQDLRGMMKDVINSHDDNDISMLMWAVWRLKENVVKELVSLGADINYGVIDGETVVTFWDNMICGKKPLAAANIAEFLHGLGLDLSIGSCKTWSIVRRARELNLTLLIERLTRLGYHYSVEEVSDRSEQYVTDQFIEKYNLTTLNVDDPDNPDNDWEGGAW